MDNLYAIYYSSILLMVFAALANRRYLYPTDRWIVVVVMFALVVELSSFVAMRTSGTNLHIYHVATLVETFILLFYFKDKVGPFSNRLVSISLVVVTFLVWVLNALLLNTFYAVNSLFLWYKCFLMVGLVMALLVKLLRHDAPLKFYRVPYFWFSFLMLFHECAETLVWAVHDYALLNAQFNLQTFSVLTLSIALAVNIGFVAIFIFYRKITIQNYDSSRH